MMEDLLLGPLKVGDWATWAGALGSAGAALAAWYTARQAMRIAKIPLDASEAERKARTRLVAAYLYVPFTEIRVAAMRIVKHCPRYAAIMSGSSSCDVQDDALELLSACKAISPRLQTFRLKDAAYLPQEIGEDLASGVMELNLAVESIQSSLNLYFSANDRPDPDAARFEAAHGQDKSHLIADRVVKKIDRFLAYCVKEFDVVENDKVA